MNYTNLKKIFELGRPIIEDSNFPYIHFAYKFNKKNYRLITSGELLIRGRDLDIPQFLVQFMSFHNEAVMIANIIDNKIISIVFRSTDKNKEFIKVGTTKSSFYGLGELSEDFKYGTPILLVEGHLDRDMMATIYHEAGIEGQKTAKYQLKGNKIMELKHYNKLKDAGDLVKLDITNHKLYEEIVENYKQQILFF